VTAQDLSTANAARAVPLLCSSLYLSLSTLLVEALPTLLTIALLMRYHGRSPGVERPQSQRHGRVAAAN
jgi:hypothetical protein